MRRYLVEYTYNGTSYYTKSGRYVGSPGIEKPTHCKHIVEYKSIRTLKKDLKSIHAYDVKIEEVK